MVKFLNSVPHTYKIYQIVSLFLLPNIHVQPDERLYDDYSYFVLFHVDLNVELNYIILIIVFMISTDGWTLKLFGQTQRSEGTREGYLNFRK